MIDFSMIPLTLRHHTPERPSNKNEIRHYPFGPRPMHRGGAALLSALPSCEMAVAYGSGVFGQGAKSLSDGSRLLDLLLVVKDSAAWHHANQTRHAEHYPPWLRGRPKRAAWLQRLGGAHLLFFPFVELGGVACKYGVIEVADLRRDLEQWETLYCSGRLHKPVQLLHEPSANSSLTQAMEQNRASALSAALVLLAEEGAKVESESDVFLQVARLSYEGDIRMAFGEDPNKVRNIVSNNLDAFSSLYRSHLVAAQNEGTLQFGHCVSPEAARMHMSRLPERFRRIPPEQLRRALFDTVRRSSMVQTAKSALSAGVGKSLRYALRKIGKRFA